MRVAVMSLLQLTRPTLGATRPCGLLAQTWKHCYHSCKKARYAPVCQSEAERVSRPFSASSRTDMLEQALDGMRGVAMPPTQVQQDPGDFIVSGKYCSLCMPTGTRNMSYNAIHSMSITTSSSPDLGFAPLSMPTVYVSCHPVHSICVSITTSRLSSKALALLPCMKTSCRSRH
jgi:hypothetical protein